MDVTDVVPRELSSIDQHAGEQMPVIEYDGNLVDFEGPGDSEDPLNWNPTYKWSIVILTSVMSLVV